MQAGLSPRVEHGSTAFVDANVAGVDDVKGSRSPESEDGECYLS